MNRFVLTVVMLALLAISNCTNQHKPLAAAKALSKPVGGGCDGCELMYIGMPDSMSAVDTSAGWYEKGQHLLVTGTVYRQDGKTPAPHVVIYYWQTDNEGYYSPRPETDDRAKRHGHIRGWVKTDQRGRYALYTVRPAPYPGKTMPAHIHISIKEPDIRNEYYTDEWVFDDDPLLTSAKRSHLENRGGSGILRVLLQDDLQVAEHNIVLGLNIPNYPTPPPENQSSLRIGEDQPSFTPIHAYGPDKGTRTCPVCKYGRYHGILFFVGHQPHWPDVRQWLLFLEKESIQRQQYLKTYLVYGNEVAYSPQQRQNELEKLGTELRLTKVALTFVPAFSDAETAVSGNRINPTVENTFIIYKNRSIVANYSNLKPTDANFDKLRALLDRSRGNYFHLSEPDYSGK